MDDQMDVVPNAPSVIDPGPASEGLIRLRGVEPPQESTHRLQQMIVEALADFDPDAPSATRIRALSPKAHVSFPSDWAKKAG